MNNHIHNGVQWCNMDFGSDYGTAYKFLSNNMVSHIQLSFWPIKITAEATNPLCLVYGKI